MHNLIEIIPFVGIILSISFIPLISTKFWHKNVKRVLSLWCLLYICLQIYFHGTNEMLFSVSESIVRHYIPFILLVASLFVVTGGIYVEFPRLKRGAASNSLFLFFGSMIAGWIGTTGASSLLIRPFLRLNEGRKYTMHLVVFFIFLISNIGGVASPIGDPPLFIGYLEGVNFFWFIKHLFWYLIFGVTSLCLVFYLIDSYCWSKEKKFLTTKKEAKNKLIIIEGGWNFILLSAVLITLVLCDFEGGFDICGLHIKWCSLLRDCSLIAIMVLSAKFSSKKVHQKNEFSYSPIIEVAETFFAIFITVFPLLDILQSGAAGPLGGIFNWISPDGSLDPKRCFWVGGLMSSCLDNAPTFLMMFYLAGGKAAELMTTGAHLLTAISVSTVFMGALTYIGNAPNFMVRSISESIGVKTPSFLGYMLISCVVLLPMFAIITYFL